MKYNNRKYNNRKYNNRKFNHRKYNNRKYNNRKFNNRKFNGKFNHRNQWRKWIRRKWNAYPRKFNSNRRRRENKLSRIFGRIGTKFYK
jgi:hypothetical protein